MKLPKCFTKEIFIRLEGGSGAFASTVKYGFLYSKTKEFDVDFDAFSADIPGRTRGKVFCPTADRAALQARCVRARWVRTDTQQGEREI